MDLVYRRAGRLLVPGDSRLVGDIEHVKEMVWDATSFAHRDLGGADVHAAVELHRVGVHDLGAAPALDKRGGEIERKSGLAGAGRPDDGDEAGHA